MYTPKQELETYGVPIEEVNDVANLTFLLKDTNVEIGDAEISYLQGIPDKVLRPHLIDGNKRYKEGADGFRRLIKDRRKLIYAALKEYMSELESKAEKIESPVNLQPTTV